jgi:hypothetical protein
MIDKYCTVCDLMLENERTICDKFIKVKDNLHMPKIQNFKLKVLFNENLHGSKVVSIDNL